MYNKLKYIKLLFSVFVVSIFILLPNIASAHTGQSQLIGKYFVGVTLYPLSPFVGEDVQVSFDFEDRFRRPAEGVKGKLVIKETTVDQFVEKEAVVGNKVIHEEAGTTDGSGSVGISYKFEKEGIYDVDFVWGDNPETESAGMQIFVREPTSYFLTQELEKRIWLFVIIALSGAIGGGILTFILLTSTLHPKK
jgi:hypothetical protein